MRAAKWETRTQSIMIATIRLLICASIAKKVLAVRTERTHHILQLQSSQIPLGITICGTNASSVTPYALTNPQSFCANAGACKPDYLEHPDSPCDCSTDFSGPKCEFVSDQVPKCTVDCQNGGKCVPGAKFWQQLFNSDLETDTSTMQYCLCGEGYFGSNCEKSGVSCGDHYCYNGGTCVKVKNEVNGAITFHCDCTTAGGTVTAYAGDYCEYEKTSFCSEGRDVNGQQFCVNGGMCKGQSHLGCDCDRGFSGPVCEFIDLDLKPEPCTLQCHNFGICRKGAKDMSTLKELGIHHRRYLQAYSSDFEHCVCPAGFAGLQCEYQVDICPGGHRACLHGGECVPVANNQGVSFVCDCTKATNSTSRFVGTSCEMESDQFCTIGNEIPPDGPGQDALCTNGGTCKSFVPMGSPHRGCNCINGYTGDQCQYEPTATGPSTIKKRIIIAPLAAGLGFALLVLGAIYSHNRNRRNRVRMLRALNKSVAPSLDQIYNSPWIHNPSSQSIFDDEKADNFSIYSDNSTSTPRSGGSRSSKQTNMKSTKRQQHNERRDTEMPETIKADNGFVEVCMN